MKRFISFLFALIAFSASAQFKPVPPTGSTVFGTTNYIAPDSSIWLGSPSKGFTPIVTGEDVKGTDRQVQGFINGQRSPVTLGWKQLSDLPTPPPFLNGVLIGTAFKPDGSALFGFLEMSLDGVTSIVKPNAFPVYNPGIIGTGGGTLPVAPAINDNEAVNLKQLNERTIPPPPLDGNYILMSINGVLTWIPG